MKYFIQEPSFGNIFSFKGKETVHRHLESEMVSQTGVPYVSASDGFSVSAVAEVNIMHDISKDFRIFKNKSIKVVSPSCTSFFALLQSNGTKSILQSHT